MALWVVILVMILLLVTMLRQGQEPEPPMAYSNFIEKVETDQVESVIIEENQISGKLTDGNDFETYAPAITEGLVAQLREKVLTVEARPKPESTCSSCIMRAAAFPVGAASAIRVSGSIASNAASTVAALATSSRCRRTNFRTRYAVLGGRASTGSCAR